MILWLAGEPDFFLRIHLSFCMNQGAYLPRLCFPLSLREEVALCVDRIITRCLASNKIKSEGGVWFICQQGREMCLAFAKLIFFFSLGCQFCKFLSRLKQLNASTQMKV